MASKPRPANRSAVRSKRSGTRDPIYSIAEAVRRQIKERAGLWMTCTGCYETTDGYPNGHYPHSKAFGCTLGAGCSDCGGIGAIWDTTDYGEMTEFILKRDEEQRCEHCGAHESDWDTESDAHGTATCTRTEPKPNPTTEQTPK